MKKSKLELWLEVIKKADKKNKIIAVVFGWIFVLTAHEEQNEE